MKRWFIYFAYIFASQLFLLGCKNEVSESKPAEVELNTTVPVGGISENRDQSDLLGSRLLAIAPDDPSVSPDPWELKKALTECRLSDVDFLGTNTNVIYAKDCVVSQVSSAFPYDEKSVLTFAADTPRCCLGNVMITRSGGGKSLTKDLSLFDDIVGVNKESFTCQNMPSAKLSWVVKDGLQRFVISEYSAGNGRAAPRTFVFFGSKSKDCERLAFEENMTETGLMSLLAISEAAVDPLPKNTALESMSEAEFLYCRAHLVVFRAHSLFVDARYNEALLMEQLQKFAQEQERRKISDEASGLFGYKINEEIKQKFDNRLDILTYTNDVSVRCGQASKL